MIFIGVLIYVLSVVIGYGMGYVKGETTGVNAEKVKQVKYAEAQEEKMRGLQKDYDSLSLELATKKEVKKQETKVVVKEVVKYVQNPNRSVCEFDNDWLQLRKTILSNADSRSVSTD